MKLLAKAAEERYQSAARLKSDLLRWQAEWSAGQPLSPVAPGRSDFGDRFLVPQRLYGREQQLAQLMTAFEQVGDGSEPVDAGLRVLRCRQELTHPGAVQAAGRTARVFHRRKVRPGHAGSLWRTAPGVSGADPAAAHRRRAAGVGVACPVHGGAGSRCGGARRGRSRSRIDPGPAAPCARAGSRGDPESLPPGVSALPSSPGQAGTSTGHLPG